MCRVLYVEDDEDDMFLFENAVYDIDKSIDIYYATCADDLFYFLNAIQPDYIFLDLKLPGEDGVECLRRVRNISGATPVIILTVSAAQKSIDDCFAGKANYYIQKPDKYEMWVELIRRVLSLNWQTDSHPDKEKFVMK
jgi:chemotaxis family two-component system response regulator Rcp1